MPQADRLLAVFELLTAVDFNQLVSD